MLNIKKLLTKMLQWIKTPIITNSTNVNTLYKAVRSDTGVSVGFGIGSGGQAHGVWSDSLNSWMVSANNGDIYLHGTQFNNLFVRTEHALTTNLTIANGNISNSNYTVSKSGYTPVGVVGWRVANGSGSGGSHALPFGMSITSASSGSATINAGIRAVGAVTSCTLYVTVLWIKNI